MFFRMVSQTWPDSPHPQRRLLQVSNPSGGRHAQQRGVAAMAADIENKHLSFSFLVISELVEPLSFASPIWFALFVDDFM